MLGKNGAILGYVHKYILSTDVGLNGLAIFRVISKNFQCW